MFHTRLVCARCSWCTLPLEVPASSAGKAERARCHLRCRQAVQARPNVQCRRGSTRSQLHSDAAAAAEALAFLAAVHGRQIRLRRECGPDT